MPQAKFFGLQLLSTDKDRSAEFYQKVFGWELADQPIGFSTFSCPLPAREEGSDEASASGMIMQHPVWGMPSAWFVYFQVENLAQLLLKVVTEGGQIIQPASPSPLGGSLAVIADPTGAVLGLFESIDSK